MDEKENNLEEFHSKINHKPVEKKKKKCTNRSTYDQTDRKITLQRKNF